MKVNSLKMMTSSDSIPPPPPPPPLAPPPPPSKPDIGGLLMDELLPTHYMAVGQTGVYAYKEQCQKDQKQDSDLDKVIFLSHYRTVTPIIQSGPVCGLVAAAMAAPHVQAKEMTTEKLLEEAIHQGYTKQGEMFSAIDMSSLVQSFLDAPYTTEVIHNIDETQVTQYLLHGDLLLIPYDSDKNFTPCQKKGHKAHWVLITGIFLAVNNSNKIIDLTSMEEHEDYYERNLFHVRPQDESSLDVLTALQHNTDCIVGVFVYGHQGKSRNTAVWTIQELLASNSQLVEVGPERATDNYVVPEGGLVQGLCGQLVRIFR